MKEILIVSLLLFINEGFTSSIQINRFFRNPPPPPTGPMPRSTTAVGYFGQKFDHFNSVNGPHQAKLWKQKYFVNTDYFDRKARNVAFLFVGGEGEASDYWMVSGTWRASARKYSAISFQLEHRYYGESQPFPDFSTENLRYLSSEQALADTANFITEMNKKYSLSADVKWIVFGGSYAGSLAAWLRLKYPNLVHGAVASSAPLFAKLDFTEYFQVVADNLRNSDEQCVSALKTALEQVGELLNNPTPSENVTELFNLCDSIEGRTGHDVENFYNNLVYVFAITSQYNGRFRYSLDQLCEFLTDSEEDKEIYRLRNAMKAALVEDCINFTYDYDVDYLKDTDTADDHDRQWYYQKCTEFGWYPTTNREDNIFGPGCTVDYYTSICNDVFGFNRSYIDNKIDQTNAFYGGTDIDVSNVVFVHGSMDPWHGVGLLESTHPESPVIYIEGTTHCADMYDAKSDDLPQLTAAKEEVDRLIGVWLGVN